MCVWGVACTPSRRLPAQEYKPGGAWPSAHLGSPVTPTCWKFLSLAEVPGPGPGEGGGRVSCLLVAFRALADAC